MSQPIDISRSDGIAILALNRPERRNAISPEMRERLGEVLEEIGGDAGIGAIVIRGAGGTICAGGDVDRMETSGLAEAEHRMARVARVAKLLLSGPKPIVACVEGAAFGAGLSIVAAADYVLATPEARFCAPFSSLGLIADWGLTWSLPRRVGQARAARMCMLAEVLDAEAAQAAGLVDEISEQHAALERALDVARSFAARPRLATAYGRRAFSAAPAGPDAALAMEATLQAALMQTDDHGEGVCAFLEKRSPQFGR